MTEAFMVVRFVIALIFGLAAVGKLLDLHRFRLIVTGYRVLPDWAVGLVALGLPPIELLVGCLLLVGWHARVAAVIASLLLLAFVSVATVNVRRGKAVECGCGLWSEPETLGWRVMGRDLVLAAGVVAVAAGPRAWAGDSLGRPGLSETVALLTTAGLLLAANGLVMSWLRVRAALMSAVVTTLDEGDA